jgi:hypothetical protein
MQYNLFAGTVLAVGGPEQVASLDDMQDAGTLGCFGLTEQLAGVQSGLVVETTAEWDTAREMFMLNTPHEGARYATSRVMHASTHIRRARSTVPRIFTNTHTRPGRPTPATHAGRIGSRKVRRQTRPW